MNDRTFREGDRSDHRRRRSSLSSVDPGEERTRRRNGREQEERDTKTRSSPDGRNGGKEDRSQKDDNHRRDNRRRDVESDRKRRRSRSPGSDPRMHEHYDSKRRSRDQSHQDTRDWNAKKDDHRQVKQMGPLPSQEASFKGDTALVAHNGKPEPEKQKPNFGNSGLLAAESNSIATADGKAIVLKYHEPPEARKPASKDQWKLFVFKGADIVDTIELSIRTCWLIGRELAVVDMPAEHPSISKQHAVIQFRYIEKRNEFGDKLGRVRPYLIDLNSANGTKLNGESIPGSRYLELRNKDMVQFGDSTREYVLMLPPKD